MRLKRLNHRFSFVHTGAKSRFLTRARNPRFYFVHARIAGTKPIFWPKKRHQKSGIPCSFSDRKWATKIGDSVLCIASCHLNDTRVLNCVFVNPSCKYFTPIQRIKLERTTHRIMSSHACVEVNPSCKYFTKYKQVDMQLRNVRRRFRKWPFAHVEIHRKYCSFRSCMFTWIQGIKLERATHHVISCRALNPRFWGPFLVRKRGFVNASHQSTESPILDASFWSENGVSCPQCGHERKKIGDSVLCMIDCIASCHHLVRLFW
jgi:hypothetical protein